jgi:hypothetical protein
MQTFVGRDQSRMVSEAGDVPASSSLEGRAGGCRGPQADRKAEHGEVRDSLEPQNTRGLEAGVRVQLTSRSPVRML